MTNRSTRKRVVPAIAIGAVTAMLVVGCASGGEPEAPDGTSDGGVAWGASMDEYIEAFKDVEPRTFIVQVPGAPGSLGAAKDEAYFNAVNEWSGGVYDFEINYSFAVASPGDTDNALTDGRLDIVGTNPPVEPDTYPVFNAIQDLSMFSSQAPLPALLQGNAWLLDVMYGTPEYFEETAANGYYPIIPVNTIPPNAFLCTQERDTLAKAQGASTLSSSTAAALQVTALGMTPSSVLSSEQFEALERGVIDCVSGSVAFSYGSGVLEVAPFIHFAPEAGIIHNSGNFGFTLDLWEELPLVGKQLFFDRIDAMFIEQSLSIWDGLADAYEGVSAAGGRFLEFDAESQAAMAEGNEAIIERSEAATVVDGHDVVERSKAAAQKWLEVGEEYGFPESVGLSDLRAFLDSGDYDLEGFWKRVLEDVALEHRPS